MSKYAKLLLLPFFLSCFAGSAMAFPIGGTHGKDEIRSKCAAHGGSFGSNLDGYYCVVKNCNGKGGSCGVSCDANGKCEGEVPPSRLAGREKNQKFDLDGTLKKSAK